MNAMIDKGIHRAIEFLKAGQTAETLAYRRAMDSGCEAKHLRCNFSEMDYSSAE
jgi:hypothetical protein